MRARGISLKAVLLAGVSVLWAIGLPSRAEAAINDATAPVGSYGCLGVAGVDRGMVRLVDPDNGGAPCTRDEVRIGFSAFIWKGEWVADAPYEAGDVVSYRGSTYVASRRVSGRPPLNKKHWNRIAAKGDDGAAGKDGAPGSEGPKGEKGDPGQKGEAGAEGRAGEKGDTGAQGERGDAGEPGRQGEPGEKGEIGAQGPKGDRGDPGVAGPAGQDGAKGDIGAQGPAGQDGAQGAKGDAGAQGVAGLDGKDGAPGLPGAPGEMGLQGVPGPRGEQGEQGIQGVRGEAGPQGVAGTASIGELWLHNVYNVTPPSSSNYWYSGRYSVASATRAMRCMLSRSISVSTNTPASSGVVYGNLSAQIVTADGQVFKNLYYFNLNANGSSTIASYPEYNEILFLPSGAYYFNFQINKSMSYPNWQNATFTITPLIKMICV